MLDLLSAAPPGMASSAGQLHVEKDARVRPSELVDSGAWGKSSIAEAPKEGACALHKSVNVEVEMPEEHPLQSEHFLSRRVRQWSLRQF